MKNMMGIILTDSNKPALKELIQHRSTASLPVGAKYRLIDFVLSNMINSDIHHIGIITQYKYRSLVNHIGSGKYWDLDRKSGGLTILTPCMYNTNDGWYKGTADALYQNISFIESSHEEYVAITHANGICKLSYEDVLDFHMARKADITVVYKQLKDTGETDLKNLGVIQKNDSGKITGFQEKSIKPKSFNASIGTYIFKRELLIDLIRDCHAHGYNDLVKNILIRNVNCLNLYAYELKSYWKVINSVHSYYRCNMDFLNPEVRYELFYKNGLVFTKELDEAPTQYCKTSEVRNSLIADGCIIEGKVENCVLFPGVRVEKNAHIQNSIIMHDSVIEANVMLNNVIVDKEAVISNQHSINGDISWPIVVGKKTTA